MPPATRPRAPPSPPGSSSSSTRGTAPVPVLLPPAPSAPAAPARRQSPAAASRRCRPALPRSRRRSAAPRTGALARRRLLRLRPRWRGTPQGRRENGKRRRGKRSGPVRLSRWRRRLPRRRSRSGLSPARRLGLLRPRRSRRARRDRRRRSSWTDRPSLSSRVPLALTRCFPRPSPIAESDADESPSPCAAYCLAQALPIPLVKHEALPGAPGAAHRVWLVVRDQRFELPSVRGTASAARERLATKVLRHLRAQGGG